MGTRVYVGRLPYDCRERDLEKFFGGYGRINEILMKDGFAFVEFESRRDADDAVYDLNNKKLIGERVSVELARRSKRPFPSSRYESRRSSRRPRNPTWVDKYGPPRNTEYRVLVENLSSKVSWQDLKDFMRKAGEVTFADAHKRERNMGVVDFANYSDMKNAISMLDGTELHGRKIRLVEDKGRGRSKRSHSRSRSRSRDSRSRSRSRSRGRSRSKSRDSHSRSRSRSRRSRSKSGSRDRSRSKSRSRSRSKSVDRNGGDTGKRSRSRSRSASGSPPTKRARSRSGSSDSRKSRSRSRDKNDSKRSRSRSPVKRDARSRSRSPQKRDSRSRSRSPGDKRDSRSRSRSPAGRDSRSRSRSHDRRVSRSRSKSASPTRNNNRSDAED